MSMREYQYVCVYFICVFFCVCFFGDYGGGEIVLFCLIENFRRGWGGQVWEVFQRRWFGVVFSVSFEVRVVCICLCFQLGSLRSSGFFFCQEYKFSCFLGFGYRGAWGRILEGLRVLVLRGLFCLVTIRQWGLVGFQYFRVKVYLEFRVVRVLVGFEVFWFVCRSDIGNIEMYRIQFSNLGMNVRFLKRNLFVIKIMYKFQKEFVYI